MSCQGHWTTLKKPLRQYSCLNIFAESPNQVEMKNVVKSLFVGIPSYCKHTVSSDDQSTPEEEPIHRVAATVDDLGKIKIET